MNTYDFDGEDDLLRGSEKPDIGGLINRTTFAGLNEGSKTREVLIEYLNKNSVTARKLIRRATQMLALPFGGWKYMHNYRLVIKQGPVLHVEYGQVTIPECEDIIAMTKVMETL